MAGFILAPNIGDRSVPVTAGGGLLWALGAYGFVYNMGMTFNAADRRRKLHDAKPPAGELPLMQD